jgi:hypothetical protein
MTDLHEREEICRFALLPEHVARLQLARVGSRQDIPLFGLGETGEQQWLLHAVFGSRSFHPIVRVLLRRNAARC